MGTLEAGSFLGAILNYHSSSLQTEALQFTHMANSPEQENRKSEGKVYTTVMIQCFSQVPTSGPRSGHPLLKEKICVGSISIHGQLFFGAENMTEKLMEGGCPPHGGQEAERREEQG